MRKIYSFIAFVAMSLTALTASAATYDIPSENAVLESTAWNYRLYKNINFEGKVVDGNDVENITFDTNITTTEFKFNSYNPFHCTTEGLSFLWQSIGNIAHASGWGLRNTGSGPRGLHITSLKKGQILVLQGVNGGYNNGGTNAEYNGFCIPNATRYKDDVWSFSDPLIVEDISEEIHAAQDAASEDGATHDHFLYLRVIADGVLNLPLERNAGLLGFQIWIDAAAEEAISAPSVNIVGVNGTQRNIEFKSGESTLGMDVLTYFTIDGKDPLFMKDTEEVERWEYVYETNEDGEKVITDSIPHYKKVLDMDFINGMAGGSYGDNLAPKGDAIPITDDDDTDGDGIIVVKAATVNEATGIYSDFTTLNVSVTDIQLNPPTLTLHGFDGKKRLYSIGWSNNTLCKEEFTFDVEADGNLYEGEYTIGGVIEVEDKAIVTVKVEGYTENFIEIEADYKGIDIHRKAEVTADDEDNPIHDWDFTKLTEEQRAIVKGEVIEGYYTFTEDGDSVYCTKAEFDAATDYIVKDVDFSEAIAIKAPSCWWWDATNQRATLNVSNDASLIHNVNSSGYGYVDDNANIFPDILINCPPNANNNSCIFIFDGGLKGAFFMAQPTLTFSRSRVAAGEFVLLYVAEEGAGSGAKAPGYCYPLIRQAPEDGLLVIDGLAKNGFHVLYIDVYTYDNLPEDLIGDADEAWDDAVGIDGVAASGKTVAAIYTVSGAKLSAPQKGINIIKYTDGTAAKVLVK